MSDKHFTPIYSRDELAGMVAAHDRAHPDHGDECPCENGLIPLLRTYFAPTVFPASAEFTAAPYVPPDVRTVRAESHPEADRKPWLKQDDAETQRQYDFRIAHSCYNCGMFIVDMSLLGLHEDECSRQGKKG